MRCKHLVFLRSSVLSILPGWLQAAGCYDGIPTDAISAKLDSTLWVRERRPNFGLMLFFFMIIPAVIKSFLCVFFSFYVFFPYLFIPLKLLHCERKPPSFNSLQADPTFMSLLNTSMPCPCHNLQPPPLHTPPSCPHCSQPAVP